MERPLTVAGLLEKRAELVKLRTTLETELQAVTFDLDHMDACIRLFDPEQPSPVRKRYTIQHAARGGEMARFALSALRQANHPLTARQIGEAWAKDNGIEASEITGRVLRKRAAACLQNLARKGHVVAPERGDDDANRWTLTANGEPD